MATPTIYHMDAASLFVGDDPTNALTLELKGVKIGSLVEKTRSHMPGGGPMGVKLGMRKLEPPEPSFKAEGLNPGVMPHFMPGEPTMYTVRGNIRDLTGQRDIAAKALIRGRLTNIDIGEWGTDDGIQSDYKIDEIIYYQMFFDGVEQWYFNLSEGYLGVRINGRQVFSQVAANLGLV